MHITYTHIYMDIDPKRPINRQLIREMALRRAMQRTIGLRRHIVRSGTPYR